MLKCAFCSVVFQMEVKYNPINSLNLSGVSPLCNSLLKISVLFFKMSLSFGRDFHIRMHKPVRTNA